MREFVYGLIFGATCLYSYRYFDAPGVLTYLNSATSAAVESTHGYSVGSDRAKNASKR